MGANSSTLLDDDVSEIVASSSFTRAEIERLYARFQKLDRNGSGTVDAAEFLMIPELAMNPLVPRIVEIFDGVNFAQFVQLLSAFGPKASRDAKLAFVFRFYDVDGDGVISERDVMHVFRLLVGDNLDEEALERIVWQTIRDMRTACGTDGARAVEGRAAEAEGAAAPNRELLQLTREEFTRAMDSVDVDTLLQVSI